MKHKIVSFIHENLNPEIGILQKKVFDLFNIDLIQHIFVGTHGSAINNYLDNNDWDIITLFDVDCIPLNKDVINKAISFVDNENMYANAQTSNSYPYAAASFMTFTRELYDTSPHKNFEGMFYPNEFGIHVEADCGEVFVKENLRIGRKQILSYPISCLHKKWVYPGNNHYPSFEWGNGTIFDNDTFHAFQIRLTDHQSYFINFVKKFLNEN